MAMNMGSDHGPSTTPNTVPLQGAAIETDRKVDLRTKLKNSKKSTFSKVEITFNTESDTHEVNDVGAGRSGLDSDTFTQPNNATYIGGGVRQVSVPRPSLHDEDVSVYSQVSLRPLLSLRVNG